MILQGLIEYYDRKCKDPDPSKHLPKFGLEQKEIPFLLEISSEGELVQIVDTRESSGKKKLARSFRVPLGIKKTSGVAANLLWDTLEYVLGIDTKENPARVLEQHRQFKQRIASLPESARADQGVLAVERFLSSIDFAKLQRQALWGEIVDSNALVSFRLIGDQDLVCQRAAVIEAVLNTSEATDATIAMCLVSGQRAPVERLHASIKGVWGAQTSGANIVSFNARAFESYGKTERQGENAPISRSAAFAYTTALNHLLSKGSPQRIQVGDASTIFWAERDTAFETGIPDIFGDPPKDDPDRGTRAVEALLNAVRSAAWGGTEEQTRFYVLGLAPNAARISIRFYWCVSLQELGQRIAQYFEDLRLVRGPSDPQYPSLFRLLTAVALQNKAENIPASLGGAILDAVFSGVNMPYPRLWLNASVGRCRAEQNVNYFRAAAIKACLNRHARFSNLSSINRSTEKELLPMLDPTNTNPAYRLGRLFAILERLQEDANPGLNATIRDRFYGAASSTPVAVFTSLLRLKNAHLKKLDSKRCAWFEKLVGEVLEGLADFPKHLALTEQGRFALGYYHQRQSFYTKKSDSTEQSIDSEKGPSA